MRRAGVIAGLYFLVMGFITPIAAQNLNLSEGFSTIIKKVSPAVVSVEAFKTEEASETSRDLHNQLSPNLQKLFPPKKELKKRELKKVGSGFIIDKEGYIVTNYHVVAGAERVDIIFLNRSRRAAKIIGYDKLTDIALLKSKPQKPELENSTESYEYVQFGNSETVNPGDWVVAIGNPFGFKHTATVGIISATNRHMEEAGEQIIDYLQVDASINTGNSGGPLFDTHGNVIGINTVIVSPTGGSVGLGFAIPSNSARFVVGELRLHSRVRRGWAGISTEDVTEEIGSSDGGYGARVVQINEHGPAYEGGIRKNDVIVSFNGKMVQTGYDFAAALLFTTVQSMARVGVLRNGVSMEFTISIKERPAS